MATTAENQKAQTSPQNNGAEVNLSVPANQQLFTPVEPETLKGVMAAAQSRTAKSTALLRDFDRSGMFAAEVNVAAYGSKSDPATLGLRLSAAGREGKIPVRAKSVGGRLYLYRIDRTEAGEAIENWQDTPAAKGNARGRSKKSSE